MVLQAALAAQFGMALKAHATRRVAFGSQTVWRRSGCVHPFLAATLVFGVAFSQYMTAH